MISFIEAIEGRPVDLMGHSRGGHIAFRVAQQRPDLLRKLVLAEPGGSLDTSLSVNGSATSPPSADTMMIRSTYTVTADRVSAGDVEGALIAFSESVDGPDAWEKVPATVRQTWRDNVYTFLGQVNEQRAPFTRSDAEAVRVPTLFVGGSDTPGTLPMVLRRLAAHVPAATVEIIPRSRHFMFEDDPATFCSAVIKFLNAD
jgi:esterase